MQKTLFTFMTTINTKTQTSNGVNKIIPTLAVVTVLILGLIFYVSDRGNEAGKVVKQPDDNITNNMHIITIKTNKGEIQFETYDADASKTVSNFMSLAEKGFYDNLTFHRVIKGFMIQGGDPVGNGTGGPGYRFEDELNPATKSYQEGYKKGVVAMANAGPNTNGSQFFIMLEDTPLPHYYTIFGKVVKGQEVVDAIGVVETNDSDRPVEPVVIQSVKIEKK